MGIAKGDELLLIKKGEKLVLEKPRNLHPFPDLKGSKVRPALVISNNQYNTKFEKFIALAITLNLKVRDYSFLVTNDDLTNGRLIIKSKIKTDKLFTASKKLVRMNIGRVKVEVYEKVIKMLSELIR